jgi:hypothetical protein
LHLLPSPPTAVAADPLAQTRTPLVRLDVLSITPY